MSWRDQLALGLARALSAAWLVSSILIVATVETSSVRVLALAGAVFAAGLVTAVSTRMDFPPALRAWMVVGFSLAVSVGSFAVVGFLAGAGACLTATLMIAGLLIGKRTMWVLCAVSVVVVAAIGWAMVTSLIPTPDAAAISMASARNWLRTLAIMFLVVAVFANLIIGLVNQLERAVQEARAQTELREQAERDRARTEIAALEDKQMQTIGRLAAGIAHDFNNHLTVILGAAELVGLGLDKNSREATMVDQIVESSMRSAELTQQLLAYSRKAKMVMTPTDLNRLVEGAVSLLRRSTDPRIEIVCRLCPGKAVIEADATMMQNAIMNLLINARDAMPEGGQLVIGTAPHEIGPCAAAYSPLPSGRWVLVEVLDTGTGIPADVLPAIFEPFFTTKQVSKGTGLGLAAVAGTVKAHGGSIAVDSEIGTGTAFRVLLPLVDGDDVAAPQIGAPIHGSGRLLVVDDDLAVRNTAIAALRALGYEVTGAEHGEAAVALVTASPARFDLLLLDLKMPRLSGEATYEQLRRIAPSLNVLIWSGYGDQDVARMIERGAVGFVQKPYRIGELSRVIADAIGHSAAAVSRVG